MNRTYWQVAAGSLGRDYRRKFIDLGLAFVGGTVQRETMGNVQVGDVLLLKDGLKSLVAVGEVVQRNGRWRGDRGVASGEKSWLRDFDGWDLSAWCYVDWHVPKTPVEVSGLTRSTIQRVHQDALQSLAESLLTLPIAPRTDEPHETDHVRDDEILEFLIAEGLRPGDADDLTTTLRRIRLLAKYYYNGGTLEARDEEDSTSRFSWSDVREHEIRSFLTLPLLLALGWSEQQIKIELPCGNGRVDVACFSGPYDRQREKCTLIVETKGFGSGLDFVAAQATNYARDFPACNTVAVTNGYCYKVYMRSEDKTFSMQRPTAYLNLLRPTRRYPLDPEGVSGALDVLKCLFPGNVAALV